MKFDIFFSICQTEVEGFKPNERQMYLNFFDQVKCADELGFETAWVAETHLSCQVQKMNSDAVIPHFKGEIGLNTNILQLAHLIFAKTKRINVGSAIMNILCNGGPLAHAEDIKMFLALHGLDEYENRHLNIGFAAGRFPFSNIPYGITPRDEIEEVAWPVLKGLIFKEATEIFLRALNDEIISSKDISPKMIHKNLFRNEEEWVKVQEAYKRVKGMNQVPDNIEILPFWKFDKVGVIPFESRKDLLKLTIGSHDFETQKMANTILPCGVFNLSITPKEQIEETHQQMEKYFNPNGGRWKREYMPRTVMIFVNGDEDKSSEEQTLAAKQSAEIALKNYWLAMEGTLDLVKVQNAVNNAIAGNPMDVANAIREKYHPEDRLMLWFDFNNHNNEEIIKSMKVFMQYVVPLVNME